MSFRKPKKPLSPERTKKYLDKYGCHRLQEEIRNIHTDKEVIVLWRKMTIYIHNFRNELNVVKAIKQVNI